MFSPLLRKLESANYKANAKRGGLACPDCGAKKPLRAPRESDDVITCDSCGTKASALEWAASSAPQNVIGRPGPPPATSRITREVDAAGSTVWNIPASGRSGGLMVFAILWTAITAVVSGGFLVAFLSGEMKESGNFPDWAILPFFGIFWAVGLGMFYAAFRNKYARHRISANCDSIRLRREFFGSAKEKSLPSGSIRSVAQVQFYQQNYEPVLGIEIKGSHGKLRFGSILSAEEKAWLVADIQHVLSGSSPTSAGAAFSHPEKQAVFSIAVPESKTPAWPLAVILSVTGTVGLCFAIGFLRKANDAPARQDSGIFRAIDTIFNQFPVMMLLSSGVITLIGWYMLIRLIGARGQETRIEGSDSEIAIRRHSRGRIIHERAFPRSSVTNIRSFFTGNTDTTVMKRVELIVGEKAEPVTRWADGNQADAMVAEVRRALGLP
jgi:uncharacterized membrane protein